MNVPGGQPQPGFGQGQCFPKVSDPKNSPVLLLRADAQALAQENQKVWSWALNPPVTGGSAVATASEPLLTTLRSLHIWVPETSTK